MQMQWQSKKQYRQRRKSGILLLSLLFFSIAVYCQTIQLSLKNVSLETALQEIEKKSSYRFIYTKEEINNAKPVTLSVSSSSIETVLEKLLQDQSLAYSINKQYITIYKATPQRAELQARGNQTIHLIGKIVDDKGLPVVGATIHYEGANIYVTSDVAGNFSIPAAAPGVMLIVSSVGYDTKQMMITEKANILIRLNYAVNMLEETIIKGYYTTSKRLNTGSVSKVTAEELMKQPISNPLAGLQGRVPGLFIRQSNGLPGANFSLLIRGQNSLRNGTAPLYLIDGVPFPVSNVNQRGAALNSNNPFNTISPSDIESIEVLKDADAIAIYGSRGANGVILITTKRGKEAKTSVEANFYQGWGQVTKMQKLLNTHQYLALRREAFRNDGVQPTIANAPDLLAWDTTRYTNWQKLLIGGTANFSNAQLRYSGGSPLTKFTLNTNFYRETTVFPSDFKDRRITTELSVSHSNKKGSLKTTFTTNYGREENNLLSTDVSAIINLPPNAPGIYDSLGRLNWIEGGMSYNNPFGELLKTYDGRSTRWTSSFNVSYEPVKALLVKLNGGYNNFQFDETLLNPKASQNPANNPLGSASFGYNNFSGWILEPQVEYNRKIKLKNQLDILIGTTFQANTNESNLVSGNGYTNDALLNSLGGAASITATNNHTEYKYSAAFARLQYSYDKKYLVNFTGRRDGSSRFGPGRQFASFGAVGFGWIFSDEQWIKEKLPSLSFGKLRGSYGSAGNDQIGDYQYIDTWTATQFPYGGGIGLRPTRLFNEKYGWELNLKLNIGLEAAFLNNRISIVADWYRNVSKNQLIQQSLPSQTGFASVVQNFPGQIENKGLEMAATVVPIRNTYFQWTSHFNLTTATNRLTKFPGLESSSFANSYRVGKPVNSRIGYTYAGLNANSGLYEFVDINMDNALNTKDYVYLGTTDPTYYGGFQNTLAYKQWQVDLLFQFVKQKWFHPVWRSSFLHGDMRNFPSLVLDRWTKAGENAFYQKSSQALGTPASNAAFLMSQSDAVLTEGSFLRLKNFALSYSLNPLLTKKIKAEAAKVYLQAQNLLTLTRFIGADPENNSGLSPLRVVTLGLNVQF
jgi:TonB-dependent starch-binding outer membrane protein SusC